MKKLILSAAIVLSATNVGLYGLDRPEQEVAAHANQLTQEEKERMAVFRRKKEHSRSELADAAALIEIERGGLTRTEAIRYGYLAYMLTELSPEEEKEHDALHEKLHHFVIQKYQK